MNITSLMTYGMVLLVGILVPIILGRLLSAIPRVGRAFILGAAAVGVFLGYLMLISKPEFRQIFGIALDEVSLAFFFMTMVLPVFFVGIASSWLFTRK